MVYILGVHNLDINLGMGFMYSNFELSRQLLYFLQTNNFNGIIETFISKFSLLIYVGQISNGSVDM